MLEDETLSIDDQEQVKAAAIALEKAIDELVPIKGGADEPKPDGGKDDPTQNGNTPTGDSGLLALALLCAGAAGAVTVLRRKNRKIK